MTRRRLAAFAALLVLVAAMGGCADYHLRVKKPAPAGEYQSATMHAFFWGAIEEQKVADTCEANALDEVRVGTNFGYALATVVTLGIWMPIDVHWRCAKEPLGQGGGL